MNQWKSAWKMLAKFRMYTWICLAGLGLSLACILVLARYIHRELTVDRFCGELDRMYVLTRQYLHETTSLASSENINNNPNFINLLDDPGVIKRTRCIPFTDEQVTYGQRRFQVKTIVTDSMFLRIFPYPVILGTGALKNPTDAVITRKLARRLFGNDDPLGKPLTFSSKFPLTVVGVVGEPATKSSLDFDLLVSSDVKKAWVYMGFDVAVLAPGVSMETINKRDTVFKDLRGFSGRLNRLQLFPYKKLYFDKTVGTSDAFLHGNRSHVVVLSIVAVLLLVVGLFNFINIYTVMMLKRARELGVRKVYGADGFRMFTQLFAENLLMAGASLLIAWILVEISGGLLERYLDIPRASDPRFDWLLSLGILLGLPAVTTVYPFLKYNYTAPTVSIRSVNVGGQSVVSRVAFLAAQYVITCVLIVVSLFFVRQLRFMLSADLGYDSGRVLTCRMFVNYSRFDTGSEEEIEARWKRAERLQEEVRTRMDACPFFSYWLYGANPNRLDETQIAVRLPEQEEFKNVFLSEMSADYLRFFDFKLKEGRLWNDSIDRWAGYKMIINESARKLFGIRSLDTALLQPETRLWFSYGMEGMDTNPPYEVVGVIEDFRIGHLSRATPPLVIVYDDSGSLEYDLLMARVVPGKMQEAIAFLQRLHADVAGEGDFEYQWLDDDIARMYREDERTVTIYSLFAGIAIIISCLGLFGLSLFDLRQRYREIALRKVNGAPVRAIVRLLLKKYVYILAAVFVVSVPAAYGVIHWYLEGFAYRAPVSWWLFAAAVGVTTVLSLVTLIWQVRKAAAINPAHVLKGE